MRDTENLHAQNTMCIHVFLRSKAQQKQYTKQNFHNDIHFPKMFLVQKTCTHPSVVLGVGLGLGLGWALGLGLGACAEQTSSRILKSLGIKLGRVHSFSFFWLVTGMAIFGLEYLFLSACFSVPFFLGV